MDYVLNFAVKIFKMGPMSLQWNAEALKWRGRRALLTLFIF